MLKNLLCFSCSSSCHRSSKSCESLLFMVMSNHWLDSHKIHFSITQFSHIIRILSIYLYIYMCVCVCKYVFHLCWGCLAYMTLKLHNLFQEFWKLLTWSGRKWIYLMLLTLFLSQLHQHMENGNYESETSILSAEQIEEIVPRKVSPLYTPR